MESSNAMVRSEASAAVAELNPSVTADAAASYCRFLSQLCKGASDEIVNDKWGQMACAAERAARQRDGSDAVQDQSGWLQTLCNGDRLLAHLSAEAVHHRRAALWALVAVLQGSGWGKEWHETRSHAVLETRP